MKAGLPILVCGAIAFAATAMDASEPDGMRAKLHEKLRREFTFQLPTDMARATEESADAVHGILVLPELNVIESRQGLEIVLREQRDRFEREEFSWRHGGTIKKLERLPFKPTLIWRYSPEHNGIDLLKFSW